MKTTSSPVTFAFVMAFALATGGAMAQSSEVEQDQAQLRADEAAQVHERAQLKADQKTMKADTRSGRMAAESPDADKVYQDRTAISGQEKAIASDQPGSLQMNADKSALKREEGQLGADRKALASDTRSGRMAAESSDAEKVYKDKQYVSGERKDIAADKANLKTDEKMAGEKKAGEKK